MKKILAIALLVWASLVNAQSGNFPALVGQRGLTPPTNCTIAQLFFDTDATAGANLYGCTAANTWTALGGGGGPTTNPVTGAQGGTGIVNTGKTLTLGTGALTFVSTNATIITFPTTSATLARTDAAQTFTGTQTFSGNIVPSQTNGIVGTTTNNNANAGSVGEYVESVISTNTNFSTSGQYADLTSISLTAGDWDVTDILQSTVNGATVTRTITGISTTAGNSATGIVFGSNGVDCMLPGTLNDSGCAIPSYRISLNSTTTIYLKYFSTYTVSTPQAKGRLSARRIR